MCRATCVLIALAFVTSSACSRVPPLQNTQPTAEALSLAVLEALQRRDRPALQALALSETEFRDHVWPQLPASRPERNLPFSFVWGDLHQKSEGALGNTLTRYGGRRYELLKVTFDGDTDYVTYRVHREAKLHVKLPSGTSEEVRVCGSMLEKDGAWKVFSYVVEE